MPLKDSQQHMNVIRHYDPCDQLISYASELEQRVRDQSCYTNVFEECRTTAKIKRMIDLLKIFGLGDLPCP